MAVFGAVVAIVIYFTIFGILVKDSVDQIRRGKNEWKIIGKNNRGKHWKV